MILLYLVLLTWYFRPRLGAAFHKVLFVGAVYFISSSVEGCYRAIKVSVILCSMSGFVETGKKVMEENCLQYFHKIVLIL